MSSAAGRVKDAFARISATDRPEVWITLRPIAEALSEADAIDARVAAGERLPLAGLTVAVKDNIDVLGLPTTAGCPAFGYAPDRDAVSVARLRAAGAVVVGKTNLDQFATGLVGTRSPYGAVRDARRRDFVSGGSSSGSAVAVALGQVDLGLATDTAGSGRVPAAFQGIVGVKPTRRLISTAGVVPACRTLDCVSVMASDVGLAERAFGVMSDPLPPDAPLGAPPAPRVAIPRAGQLDELSAAARQAFERAARDVEAELVEIDIEPFLDAGKMLYGGAFLAERYAAVGEFIARNVDLVDPTVAQIILSGASFTAAAYVGARERIERLRLTAMRSLQGCDALLLPTAPCQPTIAQVAADPIDLNLHLGRYTTFCNLFDMCATSVPAGVADGAQFGVTFLGPPLHERVVADLARRLGPAGAETPAAGGIELFVVGAHLGGQPLNSQLTSRGGRFVRAAETSTSYRMFALDTVPPKPGIVRGSEGAAIQGELWALPATGLATLLAELPSPMALGRVVLSDGAEVVGFLCEPAALDGAVEITSFGGWLAFLAASRNGSGPGLAVGLGGGRP
jgi:allophanate hydrolase